MSPDLGEDGDHAVAALGVELGLGEGGAPGVDVQGVEVQGRRCRKCRRCRGGGAPGVDVRVEVVHVAPRVRRVRAPGGRARTRAAGVVGVRQVNEVNEVKEVK